MKSIRIPVLAIPFLLLFSVGCTQSGDGLGPLADANEAAEIRVTLFGEADPEAEGGGEAVAESQTGSGWATLRGRFVFDGNPPTLPTLIADKDLAICAPGGRYPPDDSFVCEGANGGIANIAVYLRSAPRVHDSAKASDTPVEFDQRNCIFLTHVTPIVVGETLLIKNSDPVGHNTKIEVVKGTPINPIIPANSPGTTYKVTREESRPAPISCSIHTWMRAYLLPRENGYVGVTAGDGTFEIANLPAGVELEFQVWHERAATSNGGLAVESPEAAALNWSKRGRFSVTLEEGQTREIEIKIPVRAFRL